MNNIQKLEPHYVIMVWMKSGKKHVIRNIDDIFLRRILDAFRLAHTYTVEFEDGNWRTCIKVSEIEAISVLPKKEDEDCCDAMCYETKCKGYCIKEQRKLANRNTDTIK